jgi:hypothetical protein
MIFGGAFLQQSPSGFFGDIKMNYVLALALAFGYIFRSWKQRVWFVLISLAAFLATFGFALDEIVFVAALLLAYFILDFNIFKKEVMFVIAVIVSTMIIYNISIFSLAKTATQEVFYTLLLATFFAVFLHELETSEFFARRKSFLRGAKKRF